MTDLLVAPDYPADYLTPEEVIDEGAYGLPEDALERLLFFAQAEGDLTPWLDDDTITRIGGDCVDDWERDRNANSDWRNTAEEALERAAQAVPQTKTYPFDGAANVRYPILTVAAMQFAARAYPAIIKGDEAVQVKVIGPDPQGSKQARADRVKDYMNYQLFYRMEGWEEDTDTMLNQLPVVGQAFRKVFYDPILGAMRSEFVPALNVAVPPSAKSLLDSPRITQDYEAFPYQIKSRQRAGEYRDVDLDSKDDDEQKPRCLIEQHTLIDLDGDDVEEPYICTVDVESRELLRIEPAYDTSRVKVQGDRVIAIDRWMPFVGYQFIPDPKGGFYGIGFGQLLKPMSDVIDSIINQSLDAGHAQVAGGGFIASGLRLQGSGQMSTLRFAPAEYKMVNVPGGNIAQSIYERTFPGPSEVLFQMLGLLMDAAKDISSVKDVLTGEAPRNQTATATLALIEQGMVAFTAIYKRIYRALRQEFQKLHDGMALHPNEAEYAEVTDAGQEQPQPQDMQGQVPGVVPMMPPARPPTMAQDFNLSDLDLRPISDPSSVTKMQELAKANFLMQFGQDPMLDQMEIRRRVFEAAGIDDIDSLFAKPDPAMQQMQQFQQQLGMMAAKLDLEGKQAENQKTISEAKENDAQAVKNVTEAAVDAYNARLGGIPGVAGEPRDAMGNGGAPQGVGIPETGMAQPFVERPGF